MAITAAQVNELRQMTGAGMMECKTALTEANGDMDEAVTVLRKRGTAKAAKKADRETPEGMAFIEKISGKASLVLLGCETDFVARNDKFQEFGKELAKKALQAGAEATQAEGDEKILELVGVIGENMKVRGVRVIDAPVIGSYIHSNGKIGVLVGLSGANEVVAADIAMHAAAMNPLVLSPANVTDELVAKEKEIWAEQLKNEGKPENIIANIMMGKEKKFREESALIAQPFVKNPSQTVAAYAKEHGAEVVAFARLAI